MEMMLCLSKSIYNVKDTSYVQCTSYGCESVTSQKVCDVSEMMMMKSVFWWRKPEYPEETTDLRHQNECKSLFIVLVDMETGAIIIW